MIITQERPADAGAIEALLDTAFGPKRHTKTVYKLREGVDPVPGLSFVALESDGGAAAGGAVAAGAAAAGAEPAGTLAGTIRYWPIRIGDTDALLLGPIAVAPDQQGAGLGATLIRHSLDAAAAQGHRIVLLVGDSPYYGRFGFTRAKMGAVTLPGPVDLDRFLGLELVPGAMDGLAGTVARAAAASPSAPEAATPPGPRRRPGRAAR